MARLDRYRIGIPRELSEIRTQPWLSEGSLTCDPYHHRGPSFIFSLRYLDPISVFSFNEKNYSLSQNNSISKQFFFSKFSFKFYVHRPLIFIVTIISQMFITCDGNTSSYCAQQLVTISKVVVVKIVMKTVVIVVIRIKQY